MSKALRLKLSVTDDATLVATTSKMLGMTGLHREKQAMLGLNRSPRGIGQGFVINARAWKREFDLLEVKFHVRSSGIEGFGVEFHVRGSGFDPFGCKFPLRDSGIEAFDIEFPP